MLPGRSVVEGATPSAKAIPGPSGGSTRGRSPAGSAGAPSLAGPAGAPSLAGPAGAPSPAGPAGAPAETRAKGEKLKVAPTGAPSSNSYGAGAPSLRAPGAEAVDQEAEELALGVDGGRQGAVPGSLPNYRYWYAWEGAAAEVVPRITIKGTAVVGAAQAVTGSDDFYLGDRQDRKATALRLFFTSQMDPTKAPLAERKQGQGLSPDPKATQATNALGWFLIGSLPEPSAPKEGDGASREPATQSGVEQSGVEQSGGEQSGGGRIAERMPLPGKQEADGGDYVERDWLVVGPRSEVRSLLRELRQYASVEKLDWLSGEAKIASSPPAGPRALAAGAPEDSSKKSEARARAARPAERAATKPSDKAGSDASPTTKPEPVLRVVVRFRARR